MSALSLSGPAIYNPPLQSSSYLGKPIDLGAFFNSAERPDTPHPYDNTNFETLTLPVSWIGDSQRLKNVYELAILSANDFILQYLMPLQLTDAVRVDWSQTVYVPALAASTPFLGVTRLVQSNRRSGSAMLRRVGLGAFFEDGFLNGPDGPAHFAMTLRQILQGFLQGMQFDALASLMSVGDQELEHLKMLGGNTVTLSKTNELVIKNELFRWGILQQTIEPWSVLVDHVTTPYTTINNGANFNTVVASTTAQKFLRNLVFVKQNDPAYRPGLSQNAIGERGVSDFYVDSMGHRVFFASDIHGEAPTANPLERDVMIGEFFPSRNHLLSSNPRYYSTASRELRFYDMQRDAWATVTLAEMIKHSSRFDSNGRLLSISDITKQLPSSGVTDFLHDKAGNALTYIGDLAPRHLHLSDVQYHVETALNSSGISRDELHSAFASISEALAIIGRVNYTAALDTWLTALANANRPLSVNRGINQFSSGQQVISSNVHGSLDLPAGAAPPAAWLLPPTHGDYGGLKTLEALSNAGGVAAVGFSESYARKIAQAMPVFDRFADSLEAMYPDSPLVSARLVNGAVQGATHRHAVFANIFHLQNPVAYVHLHRVSGGIGALRGDRIERGEVQDIGTLEFAPVTAALGYAKSYILGPVVPMNADMEVQVNIGAPLGFQGGDNPDAFYLFEPTRLDDSSVSKLALERFKDPNRQNLLPAAPNYDAVDAAQDITKVDNPNAIYDAIARWVLLPVTTKEQYAVRGFITSMLTYVRVGSGSGADYYSKTMNIFKQVIGVIQNVTGITMHTTETPETDGTNARFRSVTGTNAGAKATIDAIANGINELRTRIPGIFRKGLPRAFASEVAQTFKSYIDTELPTSAAGVTTNQDAQGYGNHLNPDITVYVPAPVSVGRTAAKDYLDFAFRGANVRRVVLASYTNPSRMMSTSDLAYANRISVEESPSSRLSQLLIVGPVFAPASDYATVAATFDFIPAVYNAKSYLAPDADLNLEAVQMGRAAVRQSLGAGSLTSLMDDDEADPYRAAPSSSTQAPMSERFSRFGKFSDEIKDRTFEVGMAYRSMLASHLVALCFLTSQITLRTLLSFATHNLDVPFNFILARPHQRFTSHSLIFMIAGAETATYGFGKVMASFGSDATTQSTSVTVRGMHGPIIRDPKRVFIVHNGLITGYHGGAGSAFITPAAYDPNNGQFGRNDNESLISMLYSRHDDLTEAYIHLTGKTIFRDRLGNQTNLTDESPTSNPVAQFYNAKWRFDRVPWESIKCEYGDGRLFSMTDMCFSGLAHSRDENNNWVVVSAQQGHFKDNLTYPGCRSARTGESIANLSALPHEGGRGLIPV